MPIRNPFKRAPGVDDDAARHSADGAFKDTKVEGSKPIGTPEPTEFKLSEINDSGVYLPPSPPESKRSFWQSRSNTSTSSSANHRSFLNDKEPFNISRESFDSYRRSFDISARAPISNVDQTRQSLDSRRMNIPRSSFTRPSFDRPNVPADGGFEDVGLNEEPKPTEKKRGLFGFGHSEEKSGTPAAEKKPHGLFTGRKRGQSGADSELKSMERPLSRQAVEGASS